MNRLDIGGLLRVVAERLAQEADRLGQRRVGNERVLPHRFDQLLLRDNPTRTGDEDVEDAENAGWQRNFAAIPREQLMRPIEHERTKFGLHKKFRKSSALLQRFSRLSRTRGATHGA